MTDEERRERRRAKERRKRARRRARRLGLPPPEFVVGKGGRPKLPPEQRKPQKRPSAEMQRIYCQRWYDKTHPDAAERRAARAERRAEAERKAAARRERKAEKERFCANWPKHGDPEYVRLYARMYRAKYPDRKREQDRAYRAANAENIKAARALWRKGRDPVKHREDVRQHQMRAQAAVRVLRERGIIPKQRWHQRVDYTAALHMARDLGLLEGIDT
jgi:hypothetical protein